MATWLILRQYIVISAVTDFCEGNQPVIVHSPHKRSLKLCVGDFRRFSWNTVIPYLTIPKLLRLHVSIQGNLLGRYLISDRTLYQDIDQWHAVTSLGDCCLSGPLEKHHHAPAVVGNYDTKRRQLNYCSTITRWCHVVSMSWSHHVKVCTISFLQNPDSVRFPITIVHGTRHIAPLQWRHNGRVCVSNHQPHDCLLNCLFRRRSKKTSKLRVTGLCAGYSLIAGELSVQISSNVENDSIWWRHHDKLTPWS